MTNVVPLFSSNFPSGSRAQHNTDYLITITAVNNARLSSSTTLKITVDHTAPLIGAVMEGLPQQIEVDYQQESNISIHWSGFFDRETAIPFYQYIVTSACAGMDSFQYPLTSTSPAQQTTSNMVVWTAPSPETYYTTVVAYNGALQPSQPVCSDGVTVDRQPPVFGGVVIPGGIVREGLVQSGGEVWFVYSDRERALVTSPTNECVRKSTNFTSSELAALPIKYNG